jgi:hypothetical protein
VTTGGKVQNSNQQRGEHVRTVLDVERPGGDERQQVRALHVGIESRECLAKNAFVWRRRSRRRSPLHAWNYTIIHAVREK